MNCIMLSAKPKYFWIGKSILFLAGITMLLTSVSYTAQAASRQYDKESLLTVAQQSDQLKGESELPWLFAVFFITWLAFFAYVFFLSRRLKSMKQEINDLRSHLGEK